MGYRSNIGSVLCFSSSFKYVFWATAISLLANIVIISAISIDISALSGDRAYSEGQQYGINCTLNGTTYNPNITLSLATIVGDVVSTLAAVSNGPLRYSNNATRSTNKVHFRCMAKSTQGHVIKDSSNIWFNIIWTTSILEKVNVSQTTHCGDSCIFTESIQANYTAICQSGSSNPPANITWYWIHGNKSKDIDKSLSTTISTSSYFNGFNTTSTLQIVSVNRTWNGKQINCTLPGQSVPLPGINVTFKYDNSTANIQSSMDNEEIRTGDTVSLTCSAGESNPAATITWNTTIENKTISQSVIPGDNNGFLISSTFTFVARQNMDNLTVECSILYGSSTETFVYVVKVFAKDNSALIIGVAVAGGCCLLIAIMVICACLCLRCRRTTDNGTRVDDKTVATVTTDVPAARNERNITNNSTSIFAPWRRLTKDRSSCWNDYIPDLTIDTLTFRDTIHFGHYFEVKICEYNISRRSNKVRTFVVKLLGAGSHATQSLNFLRGQMEAATIVMNAGGQEYVAGIRGIIEHEVSPALLLAHYDWGSLDEYLQSHRQKLSVPSSVLVQLICDVADGMGFLTSLNLSHHELSARHTVMDSKLKSCRIIAFSTLKSVQKRETYELQNQIFDSLRWKAPELICDNPLPHNIASDVWAFGMLLYQIIYYGDKPFKNCIQDEDVLPCLCGADKLPVEFRPSHISSYLMQILESCLYWNPAERPSFEKLLSGCEELLHNHVVHIDVRKLANEEKQPAAVARGPPVPKYPNPTPPEHIQVSPPLAAKPKTSGSENTIANELAQVLHKRGQKMKPAGTGTNEENVFDLQEMQNQIQNHRMDDGGYEIIPGDGYMNPSNYLNAANKYVNIL